MKKFQKCTLYYFQLCSSLISFGHLMKLKILFRQIPCKSKHVTDQYPKPVQGNHNKTKAIFNQIYEHLIELIDSYRIPSFTKNINITSGNSLIISISWYHFRQFLRHGWSCLRIEFRPMILIKNSFPF